MNKATLIRNPGGGIILLGMLAALMAVVSCASKPAQPPAKRILPEPHVMTHEECLQYMRENFADLDLTRRLYEP